MQDSFRGRAVINPAVTTAWVFIPLPQVSSAQVRVYVPGATDCQVWFGPSTVTPTVGMLHRGGGDPKVYTRDPINDGLWVIASAGIAAINVTVGDGWQ